MAGLAPRWLSDALPLPLPPAPALAGVRGAAPARGVAAALVHVDQEGRRDVGERQA